MTTTARAEGTTVDDAGRSGGRRVVPAADINRVPHALAPAGVTRVGPVARVEGRERGAAGAGHPRLAGRVERLERSVVTECAVPDALEGTGVTRRREHALALRRHLLEQDVLGLGVGQTGVRLTLTPARADRIGAILVGDRRVLVQFGLASLVVGCVVDDEVAGVWRDRQLLLDVGLDLVVTAVPVEARVPDRALRGVRGQRPAVDVDVGRAGVVAGAVERRGAGTLRRPLAAPA